jgi:hypothetical protein
MLTLRRGRVSAVLERVDGLARIEVDGTPCIAYPRLTGPVALGDDVIVNVQARELGLGSGGFDVLHANLTRGLDLPAEPDAHVMKLPYTSQQFAVRHVEEEGTLPDELGGLPVACCTLHSQLAPLCAGLGTGPRLAYVQLPGGALPVSLSDSVRALRERGLLEATIAVGPCIDGDVQSVTVASALLWAAAEGFDAVVCSIGPGVTGTGSRFGHGGLVAADAMNTAFVLRGTPFLAARASESDARERHRGVSHHTHAVIELLDRRVVTAWPRGYEAPDWLESREEHDVEGWRDACAGLPLSHMGRGPDDDPLFFAAAFAAGRLLRALVD